MSTVAQGVSIAIQTLFGIISVPLLINYLGKEGYGLMLAVTSILSWTYLSDLGVSLAAKNGLISAFANKDEEIGSAYITTAMVIISILSFVLLITFLSVWRVIPWDLFFKLNSESYRAVIKPLILISFLLIIIKMPLCLVGVIFSSAQREYYYSIFVAIGIAFSFIFILISIKNKFDIVVLSAFRQGAALVPLIILWLLALRYKFKWLKIRFSLLSFKIFSDMFKSSLSFFSVQISMILLYQLDYFLVNWLLGTSTVPEYSLPVMLFTYANTFVSMLVMPLWPAFGDALHKGEVLWVKKIFRRILVIAMGLAFIISLFLCVLGPWIVSLWTRGHILSSRKLFIFLGVTCVINTWTRVYAMLLNAQNKIHFSAIAMNVNAVIYLVLLLVITKKTGMYGLPIASGLSALVTVVWVFPVLSKKHELSKV